MELDMHEWLILRFALLLLVFVIFLGITFVAGRRDRRRDSTARAGKRHDSHRGDGDLALR